MQQADPSAHGPWTMVYGPWSLDHGPGIIIKMSHPQFAQADVRSIFGKPTRHILEVPR